MTAVLTRELRKQLEKTVRKARSEGEAGARAALRALAVHAPRPHESMSADEKALRRRLQAHGEQLGDQRDGQRGTQEIARLAHEVAYEHWHRMLFARFLAGNRLLVEPGSGVPVSLEECAELAREGLGADGWEVAESFASRMLPLIFRPEDPALAVKLAPETRQALEKLVGDLPATVFAASDSLGWTYQFWQADRKDEVNRSGRKVGADELPAVTQLFTENYMVRFLFHNTIGAWRAARLLTQRPELARSALSEAELAATARIEPRGGLDGYDFDYLRFVREPGTDTGEDAVSDASRPWRPAAGAFRLWPSKAFDLQVLDPCCGSGHFLVEGLELLVRLRMEEEGLGVEAAVRAVLQDNLRGLEIDPRCTQIAAFNLALSAWKMVGRPIELPPLQIACSGLALSATKQEWLQLADGDQRLEGALDRLHDLFGQAPVLGSLIDPAGVGEDLFQADYGAAELALDKAVAREDADEEERERAVAAQGISRAAKLLAGEYDLVITNVPYLARGKQGTSLQAFAARCQPDAKADLATMFASRILRWLGGRGAQAVVAPQNWLFLTSYRKLRERLLGERTWRFVARLGPGAFETIGGHVVNVAMVVLSAERPDADWRMAGIDVSAQRGERPTSAREKAKLLRSTDTQKVLPLVREVAIVPQTKLRVNPDSEILLEPLESAARLRDYAHTYQGVSTADAKRFILCCWEPLYARPEWLPYQMAPETIAAPAASGCHSVLRWEAGTGSLVASESAYVRGTRAWESDGVGVGVTGSVPRSLYYGTAFSDTCAVVVPSSRRDLRAIQAFVLDEAFRELAREVDQALSITEGSFGKVAFDLASWRGISHVKYPNGLPEPYSDDPTQWLFHGHPCGSVVWDEESKWTARGPLRANASVLQVAMARLLGHRWPAELDPGMRLAAEAREWVERCREFDGFADADGIVCLQAAAGELPAVDRLRSLLAAAYGEEWSAAKEQELLSAAANGKRPVRSLDEWLRDRFFAEHCKLFHHRPFIWHIWDGRSDGFHALVNYHRLSGPNGEGRRTLEALAYRHLGEWIDRQRAAQSQGEEGADGRLAAAQDLQRQLTLILEGEPPYDLFVRWRPLHEQPLGWAPNLDDGVRLNIRPFMRAELQSGGRKGAGILRVKPNIKWSKDRGKEPESLRPREDFPWFYSFPGPGPEADRTDYAALPEAAYDGNRWNDLHYTRAAKKAARGRLPVVATSDRGGGR